MAEGGYVHEPTSSQDACLLASFCCMTHGVLHVRRLCSLSSLFLVSKLIGCRGCVLLCGRPTHKVCGP